MTELRDTAKASEGRAIPGDAESPMAGRQEDFPVWPRRRATALALGGLLLVQAFLFLAVTQRGFFATDDFIHFRLAEERGLLHFLLSPILGVYPAPGHRAATAALHGLFPLNYTVARLFLLVGLALTTVLLAQLVRYFARTDRWWTVALVVPFALSATLVSPVWWWSNGLPVIPGLLFTALALHTWLRSYTDQRRWLWTVWTAVAVAAAGSFHIKFLLIPAYLGFFRLLILPRIAVVTGGLSTVWRERWHWIVIASPAIAFVAVLQLSGLAGRSLTDGGSLGLWVEYLEAAWFHVVVPVSFLNTHLVAPPDTLGAWALVGAAQVVFWVVVVATLRRSALAVHGWALFVFVFLTNIVMVGAARLAQLGVEDIAYTVRYYPEVVFFLPLALALGLRQGCARRSELAWEHRTAGQAVMVAGAVLFTVAFVVSAPPAVSASDGAQSRIWFDNVRGDLAELDDTGPTRFVDSETPEYVIPGWTPGNRVSTIFQLLDVDAIFNEQGDRMYAVAADGRIRPVAFRPLTTLLSEQGRAPGVVAPADQDGCLAAGEELSYRPVAEVTGARLAVRTTYADRTQQPAVLKVEWTRPHEDGRRIQLRPDAHVAEVIDLDSDHLSELVVAPGEGDRLCFERIELGSLVAEGRD